MPTKRVRHSKIRHLINTNDKHGSIVRWSRDDDLLGASLKVSRGLGLVGEDTGRLNHILGTSLLPGDLSRVLLGVEGNLVTVHNKLAVLLADLTLEASVGRVVLEHVNLHVQRILVRFCFAK